jgi:uncharacterized protein YndB with AHSA1/START domain
MARIEGEGVTIDLPVDAVWRYMTDMTNLPKYTGEEIHQTSEGPYALGTTLRIEGKFLGRRVAYDLRVVELEMNKKISVEFTNGAFEGSRDTYIMEPVEDGKTRLTHVGDLKVGGWLRLFEPVMVRRYRGSLSEDVAKVKRLAEAQTRN